MLAAAVGCAGSTKTTPIRSSWTAAARNIPFAMGADWRSGPMSSGTSARCRFPIIRSISSCSILRINGDHRLIVMIEDRPRGLGESSWLAKKYGRLLPSWEDDIRQGFEECMRVLKPNGTLIFKWNEQQIPTARIIEIIGQKPLFGHTSGKGGKTIWMCFLKNEKSNETHL